MANFTKSHFEAIARSLRDTRRRIIDCTSTDDCREDELYGLDKATLDLANLFARHNARFDSARFFEAAGYRTHKDN